MDVIILVSNLCFTLINKFIFRVEYKRSAIDENKSSTRNSIEDLHNKTTDSDDIERWPGLLCPPGF